MIHHHKWEKRENWVRTYNKIMLGKKRFLKHMKWHPQKKILLCQWYWICVPDRKLRCSVVFCCWQCCPKYAKESILKRQVFIFLHMENMVISNNPFLKKESVYASYLAGNVTIRQCRRWEGGEKWYLYAEYTGCMLCCQPQCKTQISEIARLKTYAVEMRQLKGLI